MRSEELESTLRLLKTTSPTPLDRVVGIVRHSLNCDAAALVACNADECHLISTSGFPLSYLSRSFPFEAHFREAFDRFFEMDLATALEHPLYRKHPWIGQKVPWDYCGSVPVPVNSDEWHFALLCFDKKKRTRAQLRGSMANAASIIADQIALISEIASLPSRSQGVSTTLRELITAVERMPCGAILLDQDLTVIAVNQALSRELFFSQEDQVGRPLQAVMQPFGMHESAIDFVRAQFTADTNDFMYRGEIFAGAHFRLTTLKLEGDHRSQKYMAVFVESQDFERFLLNDPVKDASNDLEITGKFLLETLRTNRRLLSRREISYHAAMTWRAPIKEYQITALRLLKQFQPAELTNRVARQLSLEATSLFGASAYDYVTHVACGHSGPGCFASKIAAGVARELGKEFVQVFTDLEVSGTSHPRKNASRPKMRIRHMPDKPVLIIDDVATSGAHICEATRLLRENGCNAFPLAWIAA